MIKKLLFLFVLLIAQISEAQSFEIDRINYEITSESEKSVKVKKITSSYFETSVDIPETVLFNTKTYTVTTVGDSAFMYKSLSKITLPPTIQRIGNFAFTNCTNLSTFTVPNTVKEIGSFAFQNCINLNSIEIPDNVIRIGNGAFWGCKGLISVSISKNLQEIAPQVFNECTALTSVVIPEKVTKIGVHAFRNCSGVLSVSFPASLNIINESAFTGCTGLTELEIPSNVSTIAKGAFGECTGLTSVILPASVSYIGSAAFSLCTNLNIILVDEANNFYKSIDGVLFSKDTKTLIIYPYAKGKTYEIPNSVTQIRDYAFYGCKELKSITIPAGVTRIGENAFSGCEALESLTLPAITVIEKATFLDCKNLQNLTIPPGVENIGVQSFLGSGLTSVVVPEGVRKIGMGAFAGCQNLTTVTLPSTLDSIGNAAFYANIGLTKIKIKDPIPPSLQMDAFAEAKTETMVLEVPIGSKSAYQSAPGWNLFKIINEIDFKSSVQSVLNQGTKIATGVGYVKVDLIQSATIQLINLTGSVICNSVFQTGSHTIPIPQGLYLIRVNGATEKILVK